MRPTKVRHARREKSPMSSIASCSSYAGESDSTVATTTHARTRPMRYKRRGDDSNEPRDSRSYRRLMVGIKKSVPAAIVLWAFHKLPSDSGLTSRRVINFLKKHYRVIGDPRRTGKSIGSMLRCAVEFGLLEKRGNKYYLAKKGSS